MSMEHANVNGNVKNISIYRFRSGATHGHRRDWLQPMLMLIDNTCKCRLICWCWWFVQMLAQHVQHLYMSLGRLHNHVLVVEMRGWGGGGSGGVGCASSSSSSKTDNSSGFTARRRATILLLLDKENANQKILSFKTRDETRHRQITIGAFPPLWQLAVMSGRPLR